MKTNRIEISFPCGVDIPEASERKLHEALDEICKHYEAKHLGRVMWVFGYGSKMLSSICSDELEFDDSVYQIEIVEREDYKAKIVAYRLKRGETQTLWTRGAPSTEIIAAAEREEYEIEYRREDKQDG